MSISVSGEKIFNECKMKCVRKIGNFFPAHKGCSFSLWFGSWNCLMIVRYYCSMIFMTFMMDSSTVYKSIYFNELAQEFLHGGCNNRWIGGAVPRTWPSRSPDMNTLGYFLWGYLKAFLYKTPIESYALI